MKYYGVSKIDSPDEKFLDNIQSIADQSQAMADAMLEGKVRGWEMAGHKGGDPSDYVAIRKSFSRDGLDKSYQDIYSPGSPGPDGQARAVKLQAAYLQAMERAFRLRHCSLVRSEAFAAGRRRGQGHTNGPLLEANGVIGYIAKIIETSTIKAVE